MNHNQQLYTPFTFNNNITVKNRFALAPMTTCQSNPNGGLSDAEIAWLEKTAAGGFGLVISCAAYVTPSGQGFPNQFGVHNDAMLPGLIKLAKTLKPYGSLNLIQISHAGSRSPANLIGTTPYAPSAYTMPQVANFQQPQALSIEQIKAIIQDFATACARLYQAGFDGVELHSANGYLFTQFISTMTNLRQDEYGGSLINRARFIREVVIACRKQVPPEFIIGARLTFENAGFETGLDVDENIQITKWLIEDGINYLHISSGSVHTNSIKHKQHNLISYIRSQIGNLPIIGVGSVHTCNDARQTLAYGADLVGLGKIAIANPNFPNLAHTPNYAPTMPPYAETQLQQQGISQDFINYLKYSHTVVTR